MPMCGRRRSHHDPATGPGDIAVWAHTADMRRRGLMGVATVALIAIALVAWRAWPRDPGPVAPQVTARQLSQVRHAEGGSSLTRVGGGSKSQAHRLWANYH